MATTGGGQRGVTPEVIARRERRPAVLEPHVSLASRVRTMAPRGVRPLQWPGTEHPRVALTVSLTWSR
jgi:hypothetical protein